MHIQEQITTAIEANGQDVAKASEFDLEAIADAIYDVTGGSDADQLDPEVFWAIVAENVLETS